MDRDRSIDANFFVPLIENKPPVINWTSVPGTVASGVSYTVAARATDDGNLDDIVIRRNGAVVPLTQNSVRLESGDVGYTTSDTGAASGNTTITYTATATDKAGLSATISQDVIVGPKAPEGALDGWITATVSYGTAPGAAKLSWGTSNAATATVTGTDNFSAMAVAGSQDLTELPSGTYTYTLTATAASGATLQRQTTFTIASVDRVSADITATPATINVGESSKIEWNSSNATTVSVSGPNGFSSNLPSGGLLQQGLGAGSYTFTITAQGEGGPVTKSATLTVQSPNSVSAWISVTPSAGTAPGSTTVSWGSNHATSVAVTTTAYNGSVLSTAPAGSQACANLGTGTYTFTITAEGPGGPVLQHATFVVTQDPANPPTSRHIACNLLPNPLPWQGGAATVRGDCNISGPAILTLFKNVTIETTTREWDPELEEWVEETSVETQRQQYSQAAITLPVGTNTYLGGVQIPPSNQDGKTISWVVSITGTDNYKGYAESVATQPPIPPPQAQTVVITPATYSASPGETVSFTASGGKTSYIWIGTDTSDGATGAFKVPTGAKPGETFTVSVYCPAGGELGSQWSQSNYANATITTGVADTRGNFSLGLVAPKTLPYTGGEIDIQILAQQIGSVGGTITARADVIPPSGYTDLGTFPYGIAPAPAVLSHKKTILPMNLSPQPAVYTVRATLSSSVGGGPTVAQVVRVAGMPANADPYIALEEVAAYLWDGYSLSPQTGPPSWRFSVYCPGAIGTVENSVQFSNGATAKAQERVAISSWSGWAALQGVPSNQLVTGEANFENVAKPPPMGPFTVSAAVVRSDGKQATATRASRIAWLAVVGTEVVGPGIDTGRTAEDPDTGEAYTVYETPGDHGWTTTPAWGRFAAGDVVTLTCTPGDSAYKFVRWKDPSGKTISYALSVGIIAEAGTKRYTAECVRAADPSTSVTFDVAPLTFVYDGTRKAPAVTPSVPGLPFGLTGTSSATSAGTYSATASTLPKTSFSGSRTYTWTITPKPITFSFGNLSQWCDGTPKPATVTPGDSNATYTVTYVGANGTAYGPSSSAPSNAGTYTVTATANGDFAGTGSATLILAKQTPTLTWPQPAPITFGTPLSGTQLNATASLAGTFTYTPAAGAVPDAGTQTLSVVFMPADTVRYENATATVTLTVNKATPVVTWSNPAPITYGTALGGAQLNAMANVPGTLTYSPASGVVLGAGARTLTATFSPSDARNYNSAAATVALIVNQAMLTVTPANQTRIYGGADPAFTYVISGFVNGDTGSVVAGVPLIATPATKTSAVGTYPIMATIGTLAAANYGFGTFVPATLTITKAPLTVTANDKSRRYGAPNPGFDATIRGFVNGDTTAVVSGAPSFTTSATPASAVGSYAIVPTIGTLTAMNYAFATFTNGTLTVGQAPLTATVNDQTRTYGAANPVLTVRYDGFVNGDTVGSITAPAASTTASTRSSVGRYPITLSGGVASNYALTLVNGTLTVTPAMLAITPDDQSRLYGEANPPLTYAIGGFMNGESATVVTGVPMVTTPATPSSDAGTYPITAGRGTLAATNYGFDFRTASLLIRPRPATFTFGNLNHVYDGTPKTATVVPSEPGMAYSAVLVGGPDAGSYTVSATATHSWSGSGTATLVIAPAPQTISVTPTQLTAFAGQTVTLTATGGHNAYTWTSPSGSPGSGAAANLIFAAPGSYAVSVANAGSRNYLPSNTAVATITVVNSHVVTSITPLESSYTVTDGASPMHGQTYRRMWQENGWSAYLGRAGVKFAVKAQAWPAVKALELQAKPVGGQWSAIATHNPTVSTTDVDYTFSIMLGETAPGQPLVPLSFQQGKPQTGTWAFRARVQDANGEWSAESAEVAVQVVLPVTTKTVSGRTVPPAGDLGAWFTASPVKTFSFPLWIP